MTEPSCTFDGKTYAPGTSFYPEECTECTCDESWNGQLDSPSCKPVDCKLDLYKDNLDDGCSFVYIEDKCCPYILCRKFINSIHLGSVMWSDGPRNLSLQKKICHDDQLRRWKCWQKRSTWNSLIFNHFVMHDNDNRGVHWHCCFYHLHTALECPFIIDCEISILLIHFNHS